MLNFRVWIHIKRANYPIGVLSFPEEGDMWKKAHIPNDMAYMQVSDIVSYAHEIGHLNTLPESFLNAIHISDSQRIEYEKRAWVYAIAMLKRLGRWEDYMIDDMIESLSSYYERNGRLHARRFIRKAVECQI